MPVTYDELDVLRLTGPTSARVGFCSLFIQLSLPARTKCSGKELGTQGTAGQTMLFPNVGQTTCSTQESLHSTLRVVKSLRLSGN